MESTKRYAAIVQEHWPKAKVVLNGAVNFLEALVANPKRILLTSIFLAGFFSWVGAPMLMWSMLGIAAAIVIIPLMSSAGNNSRSRKRR